MIEKHALAVWGAVIIGVALIVLAVVYWVEPASSLPSLLPRPRGRLEPSPRQARDRGVRSSALAAARLRLVPDRPEAAAAGLGRDRRLADLLLAARSCSGCCRACPELFPISSLGHSVILPQLLGWDIHQNDKYFLTFLVATHLATAIVLFLFFLARLDAHPARDSAAACATAGSPPTTPTPSSAGCWSSAPSPPAYSACCSSTRCATSSPPRSRRRSS